tara:strand:- start:2900 stop:3091 length:192 start_codon:yes stop_codon:yes gene_type:complete
MTREFKKDGSIELSYRIEEFDSLFRRRYYGYTISEAKDKFRREIKAERKLLNENNCCNNSCGC